MIESWCLGSKAFVSALCLLPPSHEGGDGEQLLISGGGEDVLRIWDWKKGKCVATVEVGSVVRPYLKVKRPKRTREHGDDDEAEKGEKADNDTAMAVDEELEHVLAVQKIVSFTVGSTWRIVFSAIGYILSLRFFP